MKFSQIELALSSGAAAEIEAAIKRAYVAGRLRNSNLVIGQTALEDLLVVMLASVISLRADPAEVNAAAARCSERLSALLELGRIERLDVARTEHWANSRGRSGWARCREFQPRKDCFDPTEHR